MIIAVDGYDGTGKTTLAKKIASNYGFIYLCKPFVKMFQQQHNCTYEEAEKEISSIEKRLFSSSSQREIAQFYCEAILWLKQYEKEFDIVLDRGLLTVYAVVGNLETSDIFEKYIENGAFFTTSIYLKADDEERVRRIYKRNPNDPDLKYPIKWRENDLEDFAQRLNLNWYKIDTNNKNPDEIFREASIFLEEISVSNQLALKKLKKR